MNISYGMHVIRNTDANSLGTERLCEKAQLIARNDCKYILKSRRFLLSGERITFWLIIYVLCLFLTFIFPLFVP